METSPGSPVALAAAAHPDDIEFTMAATLLLLKEAGAAIHMWNLADGSCGSTTLPGPEIARVRREEAGASARVAGATLHPPLARDFELVYEPGLLARAAAVLRRIRPAILLIPSPQDYMEDHQNAARLLVTAAFVRSMPNFRTDPPEPPWEGDVAIYHAQPHGLCDGLGRLVRPGLYVNAAPAFEVKQKMLSAHRSQSQWLDASQGMGAYLSEMEAACRKVGELSGRFELAEGWRRHNPLGFGFTGRDPLTELLGGEACAVDAAYAGSLE